MVNHLSYVEASSHNDNFVNDMGGANADLERLQRGRGRRFMSRGDKNYAWLSHMSGMYQRHGGRALTQSQRESNKATSPVRVCIEWTFAKVMQRCPLIGRPRLLKIQEVPVCTYINVAFFLTNLHTTLHGSQTGLYFMTEPMSLEQYLGKA